MLHIGTSKKIKLSVWIWIRMSELQQILTSECKKLNDVFGINIKIFDKNREESKQYNFKFIVWISISFFDRDEGQF